jgi:hypothetical protein
VSEIGGLKSQDQDQWRAVVKEAKVLHGLFMEGCEDLNLW